MNKTELVAAVAEETGKSKADVKEILEALIAQVVKTVKAGDPGRYSQCQSQALPWGSHGQLQAERKLSISFGKLLPLVC